MQEILSTTEIVTGVQVDLAEDGGDVMLRPQQAITALLPNVGFNSSNISRDIVVFSERDGETLTAPIASGTVLGEVTLSLDGVTLGTSNLVTGSTVDLARSEYMKAQILEFFTNIWVDIILVILVVAVAIYIMSVVRYRKLHKRHLRDVEAAEARQARREQESEYFVPAGQPVEEPTTVLRTTGSRPAVKNSTGEMEKTTVLTGVGRSAPHTANTAGRGTGSTPITPSAAFPEYPAQTSAQPDASQSASKPHPRSGGTPPAGNKARRDYFEEFSATTETAATQAASNKQLTGSRLRDTPEAGFLCSAYSPAKSGKLLRGYCIRTRPVVEWAKTASGGRTCSRESSFQV